MKKLWVVLFLLPCSLAFAKEPSLSEILFKKYYKPGAEICTKDDGSGKVYISCWKHPDGIPQPNETQIALDRAEYALSIQTNDADKKLKRDSILLKLKTNEKEFLDLLDSFGVEHK